MRQLRAQLIALLDATLAEQGATLAPRARAAVVTDALALFAEGRAGGVAATWRTVTRGDLHRHIVTIRCPDQAFFLDGIKIYLSRQGIQPLAQQAMVFLARHDRRGRVTAICPPEERPGGNEMLLVLHVSATLVPNGRALFRDLTGILRAVRASVRDFRAMSGRLRNTVHALAGDAPEAAALLDWMASGHYLLFGMSINGEHLGIHANRRVLARVAPGLWEELEALEPAARPGVEWLFLPAAQRFLYSVAQLEVVRITWREGERLARALLLGHFSRAARHANASQVPLLDGIWRHLLAHPALSRSAYLAREARTLFDRIPKPVLLAVDPEEMLAALRAIVDLGAPERALVFDWGPPPGRVRLILAVLAASRFTGAVQECVLHALAASGYTPLRHQSAAVGQHQLLFVTCHGALPPTLENLRQTVQECAITWDDRARATVRAHLTGPEIPAALRDLAQVPRLYQDQFAPETFVHDLATINQVRRDGYPHVRLEMAGSEMHIFTALPVPLGRLVTLVQNFGLVPLKEVVLEFPGDPSVHLTSLHCSHATPIPAEDLPRLREAIEAVLADRADDDPANTLVARAGLDIRAVAVLIALRGHLVQLIEGASHGQVTQTLLRHPAASAALFELFAARHGKPDEARRQAAAERFARALDTVRGLTDDQWFRALAELVGAGLRSNAFVRELAEPVAIKIDPRKLAFAPRPRPYREIFVHGRHVQGVHLRGGPVARGGLRLSDRPADFRTEVLELMATQIVKNGLIVPTGAKGGFVVRGGEGAAFVQGQYRAFARALLSVTDNRVGDAIVPPPGITVAPEDAADPYLVVAADKGTAAFSDLANDEARKAGFWLGDAFASGGSHGYDHKAFGITARGAWVCVRHHFAAMGVDPDQDPITVVGIGDMGGDVFGNGLLQSRSARLIGAFNHAHVFLDPDPSPDTAYRERRRLFREQGGWDAYDPARISPGGGVFERAAKAIPVSPQAAAALGVAAGEMSGEALIRALLTAPVDLLYNGGIGTYVRAASERDDQVRDPANNPVRVTAEALRCKVVCEGGNLGLTQRARIAFASAGGHINTDAIDNSGGVDMSDHEVNLKILLGRAPDGPAPAARNRLLAGLGDRVAELCLAGNRAQARTLSLAAAEAALYPPRAWRLRTLLVNAGRVDPATDPAMDEAGRATLALRPQLAVLTGHEKNRIKAALAREGFATATPFRDALLAGYFPQRVAARYPAAVRAHTLADEIVNTVAASSLVDRFGLFAASHLESLIGASTSQVAQGLMAADYVLRADRLRQAIWRDAHTRTEAVTMQLALQSHLQHFAEELLRLCPVGDLSRGWLRAQRSHFTRFRHLIQGDPVDVAGGDLCVIRAEAMAAGLAEADAAWLCAMPQLARSGVALQAGVLHGVPLTRCLAANRALFRLLPFLPLEMQLRYPSWGTDLTHALRGEWLHRLTHMRGRALARLLAAGGRDPLAAGRRLWNGHRHWQSITTAGDLLDRPDADPMHVILLLTRLESLIDEGD
ncbi:MAG: NAD-glutamate dehydrogenase [Nitrospirae bacterium]|nr:NAD-glutamate dehydrogenase [Nitrospirota bacterium]